MKVKTMTSTSGNKVANQFIIEEVNRSYSAETFQSYDTVIAKVVKFKTGFIEVRLDRDNWNYSRTTAKYRNQFLGLTTKETEKKIKSGEIVLADLNKL